MILPGAGAARPRRDIRCASPRLRSFVLPPSRMSHPTFDAVSSVLVDTFHVDAAKVFPEASLEQLGLDSLALMEFVFAVEDRFDVRIPEDKLDPRQAGITLDRLSQLLDEAIAAKPAQDVAAG